MQLTPINILEVYKYSFLKCSSQFQCNFILWNLGEGAFFYIRRPRVWNRLHSVQLTETDCSLHSFKKPYRPHVRSVCLWHNSAAAAAVAACDAI